MIANLHRLNALVGQRFERMGQEKVNSKQIKVKSTKTKALSKYAQALIDEVDEHKRKASERIKANVAEREEQSQA